MSIKHVWLIIDLYEDIVIYFRYSNRWNTKNGHTCGVDYILFTQNGSDALARAQAPLIIISLSIAENIWEDAQAQDESLVDNFTPVLSKSNIINSPIPCSVIVHRDSELISHVALARSPANHSFITSLPFWVDDIILADNVQQRDDSSAK